MSHNEHYPRTPEEWEPPARETEELDGLPAFDQIMAAIFTTEKKE